MLVLLVLVLVLADEAFCLLTLPPASGRGDEEDGEREQGDAWRDAVEGRDEDAALQKLTARRSDLKVCMLVPLRGRGREVRGRGREGQRLDGVATLDKSIEGAMHVC